MDGHNNNGNGKHSSWMMWLMMLPCILIAIVAITGSGKIFSSGNWQWLIGIGLMIGLHVLMMKFMPGHKKETPAEKDKKEL